MIGDTCSAPVTVLDPVQHPMATAICEKCGWRGTVMACGLSYHVAKNGAVLSGPFRICPNVMPSTIPNQRELQNVSNTTPTLDRSMWATEKNPDPVRHPSHYAQGGMEVLDLIEAFGLGYHEGNIVKYVCRAKFKGNELQDLEKAAEYLRRKIAFLKKKDEYPGP